jgi:site-specific recombinase XerD
VPKVRKKRTGLDTGDVAKVRAAAASLGPLEHALVEWLYTNGARASEPGMALLSDLDLISGTVQLHHLKHGLAAEPLPLSERCRRALEAWLKVRATLPLLPEQKDIVFPSQHPWRCYPCQGKGELTVHRRKHEPELVSCPHCRGTGTRQGITRHEVRRIIERVFRAAGVRSDLAFPHVLRHSAATHLLDKQVNPAAIQERLGHKSLQTTLGYLHTTKAARAAVNRTFDED